MADHTPGPWHVIGFEDLPDVDDLMIVAFDVAAPGEHPPDLYICNIGSDGGRYGSLAPVEAGPQWPVSLANARLIASAPDLLAALKAVLDVGAADAAACEVTFGLCPETTHCPECDARRAAIRIATTAIAKAEGRDRG